MIVNTHHFPARTTCGLWRIGGKNWPCVDPDMSITLSGQGNGGPNVNTESIFVAAHKDARQISQRNDAVNMEPITLLNLAKYAKVFLIRTTAVSITAAAGSYPANH